MLTLTLHSYAPELSRINVYNRTATRRALRKQRRRGDFPIYPAPSASYPAPVGVDSIRKARAELRKRWGYPDGWIPEGFRRVTIWIAYPPGHACARLTRSYSGLVAGYAEAKAARDYFRRKAAPGGVVTLQMHAPPVVRDCPICPRQLDADRAEHWRTLA